jgi:CRP-like cAMP-binding protein
MFVPSWTRRVRLMFDWFLTMLLGRDVVNPRIAEQGAISHALYEPGQIIVPSGDSRRYHYLVEAGEVEILSHPAHANGPDANVLSTLKAGDYFGHVTRPSLDCQVRARTRVRLLAIDREAADALSEVRPDLALLLKLGAPSTGPSTCSGQAPAPRHP